MFCLEPGSASFPIKGSKKNIISKLEPLRKGVRRIYFLFLLQFLPASFLPSFSPFSLHSPFCPSSNPLFRSLVLHVPPSSCPLFPLFYLWSFFPFLMSSLSFLSPSLPSFFTSFNPVFLWPLPYCVVHCGVWWLVCPPAARRPSLPNAELWPSGSCGESGSWCCGVSRRSFDATAMLRFPDETRRPGEDVEEEMVPLRHGPSQTGVLHRWGTS